MKILKDSIKVIILSFVVSLSVYFVFAQGSWSEPSCAPPGCNVSAPINVGAETQTKIGDLNLSGNLSLEKAFSYQGFNFVPQYINLGEDTYYGYSGCLPPPQPPPKGSPLGVVIAPMSDTCNGNEENLYSCASEEAKYCTDTYPDSACDIKIFISPFKITTFPGHRNRTVRCVKAAIPVFQSAPSGGQIKLSF